jgi:hypothetical protein
MDTKKGTGTGHLVFSSRFFLLPLGQDNITAGVAALSRSAVMGSYFKRSNDPAADAGPSTGFASDTLGESSTVILIGGGGIVLVAACFLVTNASIAPTWISFFKAGLVLFTI